MATRKSLIVNFLFALVALFSAASCISNDEQGLLGEIDAQTNKTDTVVQKDTVKIYEPQFVDIVGGDTILRDGKGDQTTEKWTRVIISLEAIPAEVKKSQVDQAWSLREENLTKTPSYDWVGGMSEWTYNHGTLSVKDSVYAIYNGRKLPLWKPERLRVTQATVSVTDIEGGRGTKTVVDYTLSLEGATLATAPQMLLTDVEEVPVTILRTEPSFTHVRYVANPVPQGNNVTIIAYDKVTATNYKSDGSTEVIGSTEYPVNHNYSVSYTSNIQVDNLQSFCGRYTLVNGAVTVQGYIFSTNLVSTVYGDAIVNGKNYKSQAPACPLTPIAVTISTNSLVYEYQGSHDGHNDIIKVTFPLSVTEKPHDPDFVGKIIYGWATDSYANGDRGVAARVGTDFHFVVMNNGSYTVYSREVASTDAAWTTTPITADELNRISASKPLAWTGTTPRSKMGYIEQCVAHSSGNGYVIDYYTLATGTRSRVIGMSGATFTDEYRYPVQGTWANGKITVDGKVYTFTGSED